MSFDDEEFYSVTSDVEQPLTVSCEVVLTSSSGKVFGWCTKTASGRYPTSSTEFELQSNLCGGQGGGRKKQLLLPLQLECLLRGVGSTLLSCPNAVSAVPGDSRNPRNPRVGVHLVCYSEQRARNNGEHFVCCVGVRSTSSPSIGFGKYAAKDGCIVCVSGSEGQGVAQTPRSIMVGVG
eukprot:5705563-Amphidinium_carterae.1